MSTNLHEAASQQPNVCTPKALWDIAQGCRASGYPGAVRPENRPTPKGLRVHWLVSPASGGQVGETGLCGRSPCPSRSPMY